MSGQSGDPVHFVRLLILISAPVLSVATPPGPEQSTKDGVEPTFETASIEPNTSGNTGKGTTRLQPGGRFVASNVTLRELVEFAYQRHPYHRVTVIGGPSWVDSARFDVEARAATEHVVDPDGSFPLTWSMLRTLLAQQFQLKVREENETRPVYALMLATGDGELGPRLRKTETDCGEVMKGRPPATSPAHGPPCSQKTPPGRLFANTVSMSTFASLITGHVDRPVIDRTGLEGRFDIELEAAEIMPAADYKPGPSDLALPPAAGPSIFVAVREQLGLRLEAQMASIPRLVIDHAERPGPH